MDERRSIERLKEGDPGGLEVLVKTHQVRAVRAAYLICRDRSLAEDVVQSAFVKAYEPKEHLAVFAPSERLKAEGEQRFRFKIAVEETGIFLPGKNSAPANPDSKVGPFAFDLEVPVRPAPVVQVDEEDTAEGISVTLDRVVNSPELPQAWICFEPLDDDYRDWTPWLAAQDSGPENEAMSPFQVGDGCWSLTLAGPVEGRSSITVAALDGFPRDPSDMREGPKTVRGPWTFEFEAPAR